jgi:hypothetical protein
MIDSFVHLKQSSVDKNFFEVRREKEGDESLERRDKQ